MPLATVCIRVPIHLSIIFRGGEYVADTLDTHLQPHHRRARSANKADTFFHKKRVRAYLTR